MTLVVSALGDTVSGGGLYAIEGSHAELLDRVSTTGIAFDGRRLARALRCSPNKALLVEIAIYDARGVQKYMRLETVAACHDIAWDGEDLVAVSSWHNAVRWLSPSGETIREIQYPGQLNSCHVNCITRHEGTWYATRFGDFRGFRAFILPPRVGAGQLVNLETGEIIVSGLTAPHSPRWVEGMWLICNSEEEELRIIDAGSGRTIRQVACGFWTRGLAYDDAFFYVGGCLLRSRCAEREGGSNIIVIDRLTWKIADRIPVPSQEIYDLAFVSTEVVQGVRRGFDVDSARTSGFRQHQILTELGQENPRNFWPCGDPLLQSELLCEIACELPMTAECGELLELAVTVTNRGNSFFSTTGPAPTYLSYKWLDILTGEYLDERHAHRSHLPRTLFSGETIKLTAFVLAPDRPGPAILRLTLMQEGVSWFDAVTPSNGIEQILTIAPAQHSLRD